MGEWRYSSTILDLGTCGGEWSASRSVQFIPEKMPSVPIGQEARWVLEPIWTLWNKEKFLAPVGNGTQVVQPAAHCYTD
jgi:hypothetical protein